MRQCIECGFSFEPPTPDDTKTNVCDNCADDFRQEEDAEAMAAQIEAEDQEKDRQRWEDAGLIYPL